jgi:hypothetical protein
MRRVVALSALALALGACGSGLEGTLAWDGDPALRPHSLNGSLKNTTSHSVAVNPKAMRLLDSDGRKVASRIRLAAGDLGAGESTPLRASWKSGKPVRIDYGTGTLPLPSE